MWSALLRGFKNALRHPAPLALFFAIYTAAALLPALLASLSLSAFTYRLAATDLAHNFDYQTLFEEALSDQLVRTSSQYPPTRPPDTASPTLGIDDSAIFTGSLVIVGGLASALWLIAVLASLPNTLVGGGALAIYAAGRFSWRRFLRGCFYWLPAFLVLLGLFAFGVLLLLGVGITLGALLFARGADAWLGVGLLPLLGLYVVLEAIFDYARVMLVSHNHRNIFRGLRDALRFVFRQPLRALGLYCVFTGLGLGLAAGYNYLISPLALGSWFGVGIVIEQLFVLSRLWLRLSRWSALLELYRPYQPPPAAEVEPKPEPVAAAA